MTIRKFLAGTAFAVLAAAASPATAAVTYTFSQATNQSFNFTITVPDFITISRVFTPSQYSAFTPNTGEAEFCVPSDTCRDNFAPVNNAAITIRGVNDPNAPPVIVTGPGGQPITLFPTSVGGSYYFADNAFTTYGVFSTTSMGSQATLVVTPGVSAVPEPATWAMMILGMGAVGFAVRSAKRRSDEKFDAKIKRIAYGVV